MKILITGASGMLGTELIAAFSDEHDCIGFSHACPARTVIEWRSGDLSKPGELASVLTEVRPDLIINAAAITNVDACERNPRYAQRVNCDMLQEAVEYCQLSGGRLIQISTDSVFDGQKDTPYNENDKVAPLNIYARTKLEAESLVLKYPNAIVLRTNIFGCRPLGGEISFGEWVLSSLRERSPLTMFHDVMYSPIATPLLAEIIVKCVQAGIFGLYHAGGGESLSKYQFALKVAEAYGLPTDNVHSISVRDKLLTALRPRNMALDSSRLARAINVGGLPDIAASITAWKAIESGIG